MYLQLLYIECFLDCRNGIPFNAQYTCKNDIAIDKDSQDTVKDYRLFV